MLKLVHRVRDCVHGFIYFDNLEKKIIDSAPFQRLRSISQLAMSYEVYPGATHKRFEHSLGVMEMATRIFDTIFDRRLDDKIYEEVAQRYQAKEYWRKIVRLAALLHDLGHLPFSHAAEAELLPPGWNHERLTQEIIRNSEIRDILDAKSDTRLDPNDVIDIACDIKGRVRYEPGFALDAWKTMLNEIITGNTFGADRMDYLLRDAHHAGVPYGKFDSALLIDGLRAVISPSTGQVTIALDVGAIHAAEALLLSRFFMYTQVYFHKVRRAYNIHLQEYLKAWLPGGMFSTDWWDLIKITDDEVLASMRIAALDVSHPQHALASRLMSRQHFRVAYQLLPVHQEKRITIFTELCDFALEKYGAEKVRIDRYLSIQSSDNFHVATQVGTVESSLAISIGFGQANPQENGLILVEASLRNAAAGAITSELNKLLLEEK